MKTAIAQLDYTTFNLYDESFSLLIKKFQMAADHGYLSYNSLLSYEPKILQLYKSIVLAQEKISDVNRATLYSIVPALDHMRLFLTDESIGAVSLLSKEMNEAMVSKYGTNNARLYIIKCYLKSVNNDNIPIKIFHGNQLVMLEMKNRIIMKRQLRVLIGCHKYFQDPNNREIFFMTDLKYVLEIFANKRICMEILLPKTICVICKKVKSIDNIHHTCFDTYIQKNNILDMHNQIFDAVASGRVLVSNNDKSDESGCNAHVLGDSTIDYEKKSLCGHYRKRLYTCEYMYPELLSYFDKNNFFPAPYTLKSEIVPCDFISRKKFIDSGKKKTCTNCYYFISRNCNIEKKFYKPLQHDKMWDYFRTNTIPLKTKSKCKGIYQIPINCITDKISDLTPCDICTFPRFFHNIDLDK